MFTCDFSQKGNLSLCDYLTETIRSQITGGILHANEKLPSKRELAEHLGISVITVQNAYGELISEGYIYSVEKRGFFVTDLPEQTASFNTSPSTPKLFTEPVQGNMGNMGSVPSAPSAEAPEHKILCDLTSNSANYETFPFSTWNKISRRVLNAPHADLLKRQPVQGAMILRTALADHLRNFRGFSVRPEQIIIGSGTEVLYSYIIRLLGNSTPYAVENPGYRKISLTLDMNGAKVKPVDIDETGIRIPLLVQSKAGVVHVTPNHHFPTGIVMPVKRRMELLSWADQKEDRFIIEDDFDSEFRFRGKPLPPLFCRARKQNVIYINTFSKTLSPSFRISYMVIPERLVSVFNERLGFSSCTVSSFEQYTLAQFISEGTFARHISRMKNFYRNLRNDLIYQIQHSPLKEKTEILEKDSGLHFLLKVDSDFSGDELKERLRSQGISVSLLSDFFYSAQASAADSRTLVINYSGLSRQEIPQTVSLLSKALV